MARYTRNSMLRSYFYGSFPPGIKWLLIINTLIYVVSYVAGPAFEHSLQTLFALYVEGAVKSFYIWQIFTYMFLHGGLLHLLFNMLTLWMFGSSLEQDWGTRRFLKYYFYCGMAAGVCVLAANWMVHQPLILTVGASGAIFGVLVAFGVSYPNQTVLMNFLFPIKAKYLVMIYAGIELLLTLGPNTGVSTVAHLGGMAFGYLYLKGRLPRMTMPDLAGSYRQWKLQRAKKKFQVYMRKHGGGGGRGPWVN
jgi:membrane associated rhomboid family serine protease